MKKITVILICLVSSLMLSGVAYASWSLSADVNVNAGTADLDVKIVETNALYSSASVNFGNSDVIIGSNGKTVSVNIGGIYPGSVSQFEIIIQNTGTFPISFDQIIQEFDEVIDTNTGDNLGFNTEILKNISVTYNASLLDTDYSVLENLNSASETGENSSSKIYIDNLLQPIEPGQFLIVIIDFRMLETSGNETMNKQFSFTISPLFVQH